MKISEANREALPRNRGLVNNADARKAAVGWVLPEYNGRRQRAAGSSAAAAK
jgi:hypothetical protein